MNDLLEHDDLISILISILCGGILGFEREYSNKSAGFRTIILICLGSTIFTIVSKHGMGSDDRISANIITGIGFIGAGVIFKDKFSVLGLTTAAVIWTAAGIGMAAGIGYYVLAISLSLFTVVVLAVFGKIEYVIDKLNHSKTINLTFSNGDLENVVFVEEMIKEQQIKCERITMSKINGKLAVVLKVTARIEKFSLIAEKLIRLDIIEEYY